MTLELEEQLLFFVGFRKIPPTEPRRRCPTQGLSYLSYFIAEQDKDQRVEDQLGGVRHRVKVHEKHVGKEQEKGDVEDHVPGKDHKGGGEEGHVVPQNLLVLVDGLLPGPGGKSATITIWSIAARGGCGPTAGGGGEGSQMDLAKTRLLAFQD